MNIGRNVKEIFGSPYYRARPAAAAQYIYAKWRFRRMRASDPLAVLRGMGVDTERAMRGFERWRATLEGAADEVRRASGSHGAVSTADGMVLFGLTRALGPEVVVETGTAAGISSSFVGAALVENGHGMLYSVDLPTPARRSHACADGSRYDWPARGVGWAVPASVRDGLGRRSVLLTGDVRDVLPRLLGDLGQVDIFFHDDLHLPDHVFWEFQLVWPHVRSGGVLVADDVDFGWISFLRRNNLPDACLLNLDRLAGARKP